MQRLILGVYPCEKILFHLSEINFGDKMRHLTQVSFFNHQHRHVHLLNFIYSQYFDLYLEQKNVDSFNSFQKECWIILNKWKIGIT